MNGTTTSFVVDTSLPYASVVEEYSGSTLAARYDYGDDLVRMDRGGVYYYLYDGLGSTRQLVNAAGTVTDAYWYDSFGVGLSHTGTTTNPFLFNAQQYDAPTGTYFLRARYYDQNSGRFLSQDPYSGSNDDPVSLHRYLYAGAEPVDNVDPSGKISEGLSGLSASIGAIGVIAANNLPAIQNAFLFVVGIFDPDAAVALGETLPQAEGGAAAGLAVRGSFSKALELAEEEAPRLESGLEHEFAGEALTIRESLGLKSSEKNVGIARYDLQTDKGNLKGDIAAISGREPRNGYAAFRAQRLGQTLFTTTEVANKGSKYPYLRDVDSEFKILEDMARSILGSGSSRRNVVGKIDLYTDRQPCASCGPVITQQFKR